MLVWLACHSDMLTLREGNTMVMDVTHGEGTVGNEKKLQVRAIKLASVRQSYLPLLPNNHFPLHSFVPLLPVIFLSESMVVTGFEAEQHLHCRRFVLEAIVHQRNVEVRFAVHL
jgi:hypothetical protein